MVGIGVGAFGISVVARVASDPIETGVEEKTEQAIEIKITNITNRYEEVCESRGFICNFLEKSY